MALESRALLPASVQQAGGSRIGVGNRATSQQQHEIEEVNSSSNVNFDASPSDFNSAQSELDKDGRRERQPERNFARLFVTNSESFASLFELKPTVASDGRAIKRHEGSALPAQAVQTYESNYNLITGSLALRGSSLSLIL